MTPELNKLYEREKRYWDIVRSGKLATLRLSLSSVFQELATSILEKNKPGVKRDLNLYLAQLYFDDLCGTKIINRLVSMPFSKSKLKLNLPRELQESLDHKIPTWEIRQDYYSFFLWNCAKSLKSFLRLIYLLFMLTTRFRLSYPESKKSVIFVINHTKEFLIQNSTEQFAEIHNYSQWRRVKGFKIENVTFLPEISFFKLLLKENTYIENLSIFVKVFFLFPKVLFESGVKIRDVFIASEQIVLFLIIRMSKPSLFNFEIGFTESSGSKRPLWTYELEKLGVPITMIMFSNSAVLKVHNEEAYPAEFGRYSWKDYEIVSDWQHKVLRKYSIFGLESKFRINGVPWFQDRPYKFLQSEKCMIAVFDVEPKLGYFGLTSLNDWGLSSISYALDFLDSIMEICAKHEVLVMHKRKRDLSKDRIHPEYAQKLESLAKNLHYLSIPASVAPSRLIQQVSGVISWIPTTTELLARQMNVPSIYFDPSGKLNRFDPVLVESIILSSQEELEKWIIDVKSSSNQA